MRANHKYFISILIVLYLVVGATELIPHLDIFIGLLLIPVFIAKSSSSQKLFLLIVIASLLFTMILSSESTLVNIVNRFCKVLSIFVVSQIIVSKYFKSELHDSITRVIKLSYLLALVIIIDALVFYFIGSGIWLPIHYVTYRFSGPFYDANFTSVYYAILFLYVNYSPQKVRIRYKIAFLLVIVLSLSWSTIIYLFALPIITKVLKIRISLIQPTIILIYISFISILYTYSYEIGNAFVDFVGYLTGIPDEILIVKFQSLFLRFDVQYLAIKTDNFMNFVFGHGPHTILEYLPRDPHNSFIGYFFELGFINLALLLSVFLQTGSAGNTYIRRIVIFFSLCALTLNIHYSTTLSMILLFASYHKLDNTILTTTKNITY